MHHEKLTPWIRKAWTETLASSTTEGHPLRRAHVSIRKIEDRTFEHEDIIHVIKTEPFVFFVVKTPSLHDAIPFFDGAGVYQVEAKTLPGGEYPIEAGLYELCINGKPAFDRQKKRFHPLMTMM